MYCSESPSMYCQRSLGAKVRVSLVFSHPATVPEEGNGFAVVFLQPEVKSMAATVVIRIPKCKTLGLFIVPLCSFEQDLAAWRTALADAGNVNSRLLLQWACIL